MRRPLEDVEVHGKRSSQVADIKRKIAAELCGSLQIYRSWQFYDLVLDSQVLENSKRLAAYGMRGKVYLTLVVSTSRIVRETLRTLVDCADKWGEGDFGSLSAYYVCRLDNTTENLLASNSWRQCDRRHCDQAIAKWCCSTRGCEWVPESVSAYRSHQKVGKTLRKQRHGRRRC